MIVIGIVGKMRVGKDTVCSIMMNYAKLYHPVRIAFADAVKEECAKATGYTVEQMESEKERFRPLYRWWGTEFRRAENNDYWIIKALQKITKLPPMHQMVLISDVRFQNEAEIIEKSGGTLIKVLRNTQLMGTTHLSETEQNHIECPLTIHNNGTLDDLAVLCRDTLFQIINNNTQKKAA